MGVDIIQMHRPLWTTKLSNDKLKQYLDALNEFELRGTTDNELLLSTTEAWYHNPVQINNLMSLANDIYKEATVRWYESKFNEMEYEYEIEK